MTSATDAPGPLVWYESDFKQLQDALDRLMRDTQAKACFIVDQEGLLLLAASGNAEGVDVPSLPSRAEGDIEQEGDRIYVRPLSSICTLISIADAALSRGFMSDHLKEASKELCRMFDDMLKKLPETSSTSCTMGVVLPEDFDLFED